MPGMQHQHSQMNMPDMKHKGMHEPRTFIEFITASAPAPTAGGAIPWSYRFRRVLPGHGSRHGVVDRIASAPAACAGRAGASAPFRHGADFNRLELQWRAQLRHGLDVSAA